MKSLIHFLLIILFIILIGCSDSDSNLMDQELCNSAVSFENDILPVISSCAGYCHYYGSENGNMETYSDLKLVADNGQLWQKVVVDKSMPPSESASEFSSEHRDLIACWIEQGALDN